MVVYLEVFVLHDEDQGSSLIGLRFGDSHLRFLMNILWFWIKQFMWFRNVFDEFVWFLNIFVTLKKFDKFYDFTEMFVILCYTRISYEKILEISSSSNRRYLTIFES